MSIVSFCFGSAGRRSPKCSVRAIKFNLPHTYKEAIDLWPFTKAIVSKYALLQLSQNLLLEFYKWINSLAYYNLNKDEIVECKDIHKKPWLDFLKISRHLP